MTNQRTRTPRTSRAPRLIGPISATRSGTKPRTIVRRHWVWLPLIAVVIWSATPLLWSLASSFKVRDDFIAIPSPFFPAQPTVNNYVRMMQDDRFWMFAANSMIIAIVSTVLAVSLSTLAAYGFARYAFRWRHILLLLILVPRLVPRVSLIVPVYEIINGLGLINTHLALIIMYTGAATPLATWIMIGFIGAIPKELDEAARVDGANAFQVFLRIVVPLSIPGILTITVMAFRDSWNEFAFALALTTSPEVRTLPYQLFLFKDAVSVVDYGLIQAFTVLTIIPILIIYIRLEKYVVSGLTAGAVK